jgi:hypothetical protein
MPTIDQMKPSKYLKKEDFPTPKKMTFRAFKQEVINKDTGEKKWIAYFVEEEKGMVMNWTNQKAAAIALKSRDTDDWEGKSIVVYHEENVEYQDKMVGGLRVREVKKPEVEKQDEDVPF